MTADTETMPRDVTGAPDASSTPENRPDNGKPRGRKLRTPFRRRRGMRSRAVPRRPKPGKPRSARPLMRARPKKPIAPCIT